MFIMMNAARYSVGLEGLGVAERAYQKALTYARERIQGRAIEGSAASVAIVRHPDIRRMLMLMRAQTEAMRAFSYMVAGVHDRAQRHPDAAERQRSQAFVDLMIPVVKGWLTETGNDLLQIRGVELLPLADPYRPMMSDGVPIMPVLHLRHWAKTPIYDDGDELSFSEYLSMAPYESTQNQTAFRYSLGPYTPDVGQPELGEMTGYWFGWHKIGSGEYLDMVSGRSVWRTYDLYALRADRVVTSTEAIQPLAGLNRRATFWLSTGIALPAAECWFGSCSLDPVKTSNAFPIPLILDVFPSTLDQFVAWTWDPNL
jgi:hypothetical protein